MFKAAGKFKMSVKSVNLYEIMRRYNPEDSHLHARRRENQKSPMN
jgi:hypothetical protein